MRKRKLTLIFFLALLAALPATISAQTQDQKPDIIFILLDDMNADMLEQMPRLNSEIAARGTMFENFYISTPMCCPSRASLLLGNYPHNHGVWEVRNSPHGGWHAFRTFGHEQNVVAKALQQDHGYKTAFMGKFFNWFPNDADPGSPFIEPDTDHDPDAEPDENLAGFKPHDVPPYWTSWRALLGGDPSIFEYYESLFNVCEDCKPGHNATLDQTQDDVYSTDYLRAAAVDLIENGLDEEEPLFLWIAPVAPHRATEPGSPPYPVGPTRYANDYADVLWPMKPSVPEVDITDKPSWMQGQNFSDLDSRHEYFRHALRSLKAVEDLLFGEGTSHPGVLTALGNEGRLENAYIFVASDNGYHYGEHNLPSGKRTFFEEDVRIPLLVRGPGVPEGRVLHHLTANVDLSRTFLELAGGNGPIGMDGRSLVPLLRPAAMPESDWRQAVLLERKHGFEPPLPPGDSYGLRTENYKYISYQLTGETQLYELDQDSYEETSLHADLAQFERLAAFEASLNDLRSCSGLSCRGLESRKPLLDPLDLERRFVAALFNPCITPGGTCTTTIVWDTRDFENDYLWIRTAGDTFRCQNAGNAGWAEAGPWTWGGTPIELEVYDSDVPCNSPSPPDVADRVQRVSIPRGEEPTPRATGQLVALPNPCFPDGESRCQVTMFVKTANLDPAVYDRVEVRNQYGGLWLTAPPNTFHAGLTDNWRTGTVGNEFSLLPGKTGTAICPSPCDISDPGSNLGPRFDFENVYNIDNPP